MIEFNYKFGMAKKKALNVLTEYLCEIQKSNPEAKASYGSFMEFQYNQEDIEIKDIPGYEMFIPAWASEIVKEGQKIDNIIDSILHISLDLNDEWFSLINKSKLKKLLKSLIEIRGLIKEFELESEQFNHYSIFGNPYDLSFYEPVNQVNNDIWNTYNQAYSLITIKIKNITSSQLTISNVLLSIMALIVAIISLLNSFSFDFGKIKSILSVIF